MSKPDCIGTLICLHPTFQEWSDIKCPHRSVQCGSYAEHGLGARKVCEHPQGPKLGLRTITLEELAQLQAVDYDNTERLTTLADLALGMYEALKGGNSVAD
jgi:hypothetical protein